MPYKINIFFLNFVSRTTSVAFIQHALTIFFNVSVLVSHICIVHISLSLTCIHVLQRIQNVWLACPLLSISTHDSMNYSKKKNINNFSRLHGIIIAVVYKAFCKEHDFLHIDTGLEWLCHYPVHRHHYVMLRYLYEFAIVCYTYGKRRTSFVQA